MKVLNSVPVWLLLLLSVQIQAQDRPSTSAAASTVAKSSQCPARDFESFLNAFSENSELQKLFTRFPLNKRYLDVDAEPEPKPVMKVLGRDKAIFPLIPNMAERKKRSLTIRIDEQSGNKSRVTLSGQDTDYLVSYYFAVDSCWQLVAIEDWSFAEGNIGTRSSSSTNKQGEFCLKRGIALEKLAATETLQNTPALFNAALNAYLCSAESGSTLGAYKAAMLGSSGQTPLLPSKKIESLLLQAVVNNKEAAIELANHYCEPGSLGAATACANPEKSKQFLVLAAKMGLAEAENLLGASFERGSFGSVDIDRAVTCFQLAARHGNKLAVQNAHRVSVRTTKVSAGSIIECY